MSIESTLAERGARYGNFAHHAEIAQSLQDVLRATAGWVRLAADQRQALTVITDKIARMLNGDPNYVDNWHDIIGYARLVEQRLETDAAHRASPLGQLLQAVHEATLPGIVESLTAPSKAMAEFAPEIETALGDDPTAREIYLRALAKSCILTAMPAGAEAVSSSLLRVQASARAEPEVREYLLAHFRELVKEVFGEIAARHDNESRN